MIDLSSIAKPAEFSHIVRGPYVITSRSAVSEEAATTLIQRLRVGPEESALTVLGGRSRATTCELPQLGRVFIKQYSHGGLLRSITGGRFLGVGQVRSMLEFEMLERVRSYGINAPRPLAIVKRGAVVYGTWLVMEELVNSRSLVEIQAQESDALHDVMKLLSEQMKTLIRQRVFHVDLHPGNVLVSSNGLVYIVDFDKAYMYRGGVQSLRDLYLRRWRRAVIKHGLSPILSEMMSLTLRSHDE